MNAYANPTKFIESIRTLLSDDGSKFNFYRRGNFLHFQVCQYRTYMHAIFYLFMLIFAQIVCNCVQIRLASIIRNYKF